MTQNKTKTELRLANLTETQTRTIECYTLEKKLYLQQ